MKPQHEMKPKELHAYLLNTAAAQEERAGQLRRIAAQEIESAEACEKAARQLRRDADGIALAEECGVNPVLFQDSTEIETVDHVAAMRRDDHTKSLMERWLS